MKKLFVFLMVLGLFVGGSGLAQATLTWQTEPVLGYSVSYTYSPGDVTIITTSGNFVIPHDSGVGQTYFQIDPSSWNGSHWIDPSMGIYAGSGVNLDTGHTYSYDSSWSFLGTPGNNAYTNQGAANPAFFAVSNFIMLASGYDPPFFWLEDVGSWQYVETWTDNSGGLPITFTRDFTVGIAAVPEPATMLLLGSGLVGLAGFARKRFKK